MMKDLHALYSMPLDQLPVAVLDLETTGLHPHTDRICELGAVQYKNGQIIGSFSSLVNPLRDIPPHVIEIHQLTPDLLHNAPLLPDILPAFVHFLGASVLSGHNAPFDISFLLPATRPLGIDISHHPILDTAFLARRLLPGHQSYALSRLAETLELPNTRFHRALDDATTTAHLLKHLFTAAKQQGILTLAALQEAFPDRAVYTDDPDFSALEQAAWDAIQHTTTLDIHYCNRDGESRERRISPQRLDPPYLYAYCHFRQEQRCFRLSRITTYQHTPPHAPPLPETPPSSPETTPGMPPDAPTNTPPHKQKS